MKISRTQAWHDLKDDAARFMHTFTDVFVNLARIAGIKDRDKSQNIGRVVAVSVAFFVIGSGIAGWVT
jgi:hypothetical protein